MNKPSLASAFRNDPPLYDEDAYGWAIRQASLIRERQLERIDWDNIAEEIESMGKSEYRATESALRVVLTHQLKWEYQPFFRSRSWENSIREHLKQFDEQLSENPSLRARLDEMLIKAYRKARIDAGQETGMLPESFPDDPPSWDKIRGPLDP